MPKPAEHQRSEIEPLLEAVFRRYGFDFRHYAPASLRRRVLKCVAAEGLASVSELEARVLSDPSCMERLLLGLAVHFTAMFRDPSFFLALRRKVVPLLRTYPFVRIWQVGCSTGEEVYALAILLSEEGLYPRCRIYATDMSEAVVQRAREGIFPLSAMKEYIRNYIDAGGTASFADYYRARYERAIFASALKAQVVFAQHNLATDGAFNQFNLVLCRNVMIYFDRVLQERVHELLYDSMEPLGVLGLGKKESLALTPFEARYEAIDAENKLFRRAR